MPLSESTKAKVKALLAEHPPEIRAKIVQLAALNHVIRARKQAEQDSATQTDFLYPILEEGLELDTLEHPIKTGTWTPPPPYLPGDIAPQPSSSPTLPEKPAAE
jgi:hypothetical protein